MQLTRAQLVAASAAVALASAGGFALGHGTAADAPPALSDVAVEEVKVEPVGEGLLIPPSAEVPE